MDLKKTFDELNTIYSKWFTKQTITGAQREKFLASLPQKPGVYVIYVNGETKPLYIGSAGKTHNDGTPGASSIKTRICNASTPYRLDRINRQFHYGPTTPGVPPKGYENSTSLNNIRIEVFLTEPGIAPSAFEHLLIQGFLNQFKRLPAANQKI